MKARKSLSEEAVKRLLELTPDNITMDVLKRLLAATEDGDAIVDPRGEFQLSFSAVPGHPRSVANCKGARGSIYTTAGRYVANLFLFGGSESIRKNMPYVNEPFNKGVIGDLDDMVATLLLEGTISEEDYIDYIDRQQWMSFGLATFMTPPLDFKTLIPKDKVIKRRDELIAKHAEALEAGDPNTAAQIEKELLEMARKELEAEDAAGLEVYNSGASGSYGNNYKATSVMRGFIPRSDDTSKLVFSKSNLADGIEADEQHKYADMVVTASFNRAVNTADGGYMAKKLQAAFQAVKLDKRGSDCKTKRTQDVTITDKNKGDFLLRYIVVNGQNVLLTSEKLDQMVGKKVKMRTPLYCVSNDICNACAGEMYYQMEIQNIGLLISRIGTRILNGALKKFHDLSVKTVRLNIEDYITKM